MIRKAVEIVNEATWTRVHRTMLVVQIDDSFDGEYKERVQKFIYSLNRPETIKADIFVMFDGVLEKLDNKASIKPRGKKTGGKSIKELSKFAKKAGYTQVCVLFESGSY